MPPLGVWARGVGPGQNKHMKPPERGGIRLAINRAGRISIYASKGRHWRPLSHRRNCINFIKKFCLLQFSHLEPRKAGGAEPGVNRYRLGQGGGLLDQRRRASIHRFLRVPRCMRPRSTEVWVCRLPARIPSNNEAPAVTKFVMTVAKLLLERIRPPVRD